MIGMLNQVLAEQHVPWGLRDARPPGARLTARAAGPGRARQMLEAMSRSRERGRTSAGTAAPAIEDAHDLALDDGRRVRTRPLHRDDRVKYEQAVAGLSARSRYLRFAAPIPRMSERLLEQMMSFDGHCHVVYAALTLDESAVVGVARYIRTSHDPRSAEVAIAVADDWQGYGLGRGLLGRVVERARLAGVECLVATTLGENRVAARLAHASGFSVVRRAGIYVEYELPLDVPAGRSERPRGLEPVDEQVVAA